MCGYLKRKTKSNRNWKKMWYVLKDKVVYVYKAPEDNVAVESFPVLGYILDTALYDVSVFVEQWFPTCTRTHGIHEKSQGSKHWRGT